MHGSRRLDMGLKIPHDAYSLSIVKYTSGRATIHQITTKQDVLGVICIHHYLICNISFTQQSDQSLDSRIIVHVDLVIFILLEKCAVINKYCSTLVFQTICAITNAITMELDDRCSTEQNIIMVGPGGLSTLLRSFYSFFPCNNDNCLLDIILILMFAGNWYSVIAIILFQHVIITQLNRYIRKMRNNN